MKPDKPEVNLDPKEQMKADEMLNIIQQISLVFFNLPSENTAKYAVVLNTCMQMSRISHMTCRKLQQDEQAQKHIEVKMKEVKHHQTF